MKEFFRKFLSVVRYRAQFERQLRTAYNDRHDAELMLRMVENQRDAAAEFVRTLERSPLCKACQTNVRFTPGRPVWLRR